MTIAEYGKTSDDVTGACGAIDLDIPRDRNGTFEPKLVPKGTTRPANFNGDIVHLDARGLSTADEEVETHFARSL